ncbi:MAG: stage III sporulation AC/AD family protein [Oscillospiraceae bacterium]|jgi:stage III sporulation protein AD|nr:stage III sporulation AC/AD family protein [Oscillospiraceae bacterium]
MIEISALAIVAVILYMFVRQHHPEYAILVQLGAGCILLLLLLPEIKTVIDFAEEFFDESLIDRNLFILLVKALGITILSQFAADICRDNGVNALASKIELAGRALILVMTLPMLKTLVQLVLGLIKE